jgi:pimeloyl-ACP methyl ester carboxylesterase
MAKSSDRTTIVFVHGLWMHASSWEPWVEFFQAHGYDAINPPWPGDSSTVAESRANPDAIAGHGITEVADHYAAIIAKLDRPPILIGHSFGGLIVQILLGRGVAAGAIAIDPAPMKGVWQLPISALRVASIALKNPLNRKRTVSLSLKQFRYGFGNAISEKESAELFERSAIPAPGLPLFQVAAATLNPKAESKVDTANATRGPLLLISGESDHTVPPVMVKSALKRYAKSPAITEFTSFPHRGHSLAIDHGWTEIADYSLEWLTRQGL